MQNNLISRPDPFATMQRVKYALAGSSKSSSRRNSNCSSNMGRKTKDSDNELVQMFRPFACVSSCYRKLSETDLIYIQIGAVRHMLLLLHATFAVFVARSSSSSSNSSTELPEEPNPQPTGSQVRLVVVICMKCCG